MLSFLSIYSFHCSGLRSYESQEEHVSTTESIDLLSESIDSAVVDIEVRLAGDNEIDNGSVASGMSVLVFPVSFMF